MEFKRCAVPTWSKQGAGHIEDRMKTILREQGSCSVMLTGGSSATHLYQAWARSPGHSANLSGVQFYFGDERCVSPDHPESNYGMVMSTLLPRVRPENMRVHRMEADSTDVEVAADRYTALLPDAIDVLLLSMGEDGHIASLFPHNAALHETHRRVVPVTGPKPPFQRLTITPSVIYAAHEVFVLAVGEKKRAVYEEALRDPTNIDAVPARLVLNRTWIFGD